MNEKLPCDIFWENVDRYKRESLRELSILIGLPPKKLQSYRDTKRLPNSKVMQSLKFVLGVQYVDLFEDWSEENG